MPIRGIVSRYVDKFIYLSRLTILFWDASYNQSAKIYIKSNSHNSVGSGVLMIVYDYLLSISNIFKVLSHKQTEFHV